MGKTHAEIQRAYRERKKAQKGEEYLKEVAKRVKKYYAPTAQLSSKKLKKRRKKIRNAMKSKRMQEKQNKAQKSKGTDINIDENNNGLDFNEQGPMITDNDTESGPCDSTSTLGRPLSQLPIASSSAELKLLTVKMNFRKTGKGRRSKSNSLKRAETKVKVLKQTLDKTRRKNSMLRQRLSRLERYKIKQYRPEPSEMSDAASVKEDGRSLELDNITSSLTPRSRSKVFMRSSGLSPTRHRKIARKLQLHEAMVDDLKLPFTCLYHIFQVTLLSKFTVLNSYLL